MFKSIGFHLVDNCSGDALWCQLDSYHSDYNVSFEYGCLSSYHICDGVDDCLDSQDELNCTCTRYFHLFLLKLSVFSFTLY